MLTRRLLSSGSVAASAFPSPPVPNSIMGRVLGHFTELRATAKKAGVRPAMAMTLTKGKWYRDAGGGRTIQLRMPGDSTLVMTCDPEVFKEVLGPKQEAFTNAVNFKAVFGEFFPTSVIVVDGDQWQRIRKVLMRAISKQDMDAVVPIMCEAGDAMFARKDVNTAQTYDLMNRVTFDSFHRAMYGWDPRTMANNPSTVEILDSCNIIANTIGERGLLPIPWLWRIPTKANRDAARALLQIQSFVKDFVIKEKRRMAATAMANKDGGASTTARDERTRYDSLLDAMLNANDSADKDGNVKLTDQELHDQLSTLFFGAYDTTSHTLMFLLNYLAAYPAEQEKLRAALKAKFPTLDALRQATLEEVESLDELKWFVDEVNRLHAIAPAFSRTAIRDVEIAGVHVKKGTQIILDHSTMARDATQWQKSSNPPSQDDMHAFRPERWGEGKPPVMGQPMPFGAGGRICPGRKLALSEMKCFLARVLETHRVTQRVPGEKWALDATIAMGFRTGTGNVNFEPL